MRAAGLALVLTFALALAWAAPARADRVLTLRGSPAPGPDEIRVLQVGPRSARHVLVLEPGTLAGAAYFRPVAADLVKRLRGWQVWAVDRRENGLEDLSELDLARAGDATPQQLFDYYVGWLGNGAITPHFQPPADDAVAYARRWGMRVAVNDLRRVVRAARKGGRKVVLGGHSLGASIAVAYATWSFGGQVGARGLSGLVLIDGGASGTPPTRDAARAALRDLQARSPFLDLLGVGVPWTAGALVSVGATITLADPAGPSVAATSPLLPAQFKPSFPVTNRGQFGYALDDGTSPAALALVHMHIGALAESGDPRDWEDGELGTVERAARVFSGRRGMDGAAWFHPMRLTIDASAVHGGLRNPAQHVFGLRSIRGRSVHVPIYAFATSLGGRRVLGAAQALDRRSHARVTLVDRVAMTDHLDPLTAVPPRNDFVRTVVPFLRHG
jgi:hypothetical protein